MNQNKFEPFLRLCQILGLGLVSNILGCIYQVVLLVAYLAVSVFAINDEIQKIFKRNFEENKTGDISSTITQTQHLFGIFVEVQWLGSVLFCRRFYKNTLEDVEMVDKQLTKLTINYKGSSGIRKIYYVGLIPVVLIISIRIGTYNYLCPSCGICAQISTTLADMLTTIGVFQLFIYAHVISNIFQAINKHLDKLKERIDISQIELDVQVYTLASCHHTASKAADEFTGAFMYQILIFVIGVFLRTLFTSYQNTNQLLTVRLMATNVWNIIVLLLLMVVIHSCTTICEHANNSGRLVHTIIRETHNENDDALNMMSLQLIHRHVELVCLGMFPINYNILYHLTRTAAIYIVVLVQFDQAEKQTAGI